jgi:hypothetical protein
MYFVECGGDRQWLGIGGYVGFVMLYLVVQGLTRFENPLHGALAIILLSVFYALAIPSWVHARVANARPRVLVLGPNPRLAPACSMNTSEQSDGHWLAAGEADR